MVRNRERVKIRTRVEGKAALTLFTVEVCGDMGVVDIPYMQEAEVDSFLRLKSLRIWLGW